MEKSKKKIKFSGMMLYDDHFDFVRVALLPSLSIERMTDVHTGDRLYDITFEWLVFLLNLTVL